MAATFVAVFLAVALGQGQAPAVSLSDLDVVKSLYLSASYDAVLQRLSTLDTASVTGQLEQYRALSLLALGRRPEAEQSIERLVRQSPFYTIDEGDVSPRVAGIFREVRQRVLPSVARDLYTRGKGSFERKDYGSAADQLKSLLTLLGDADLAKQADPNGDIKELAEGFLRLAQIATATPPAPAPSAGPPAVAATAGPPQPTVTKIVIYSASDAGVTPPVEIERRMPPWTPPAVMARNAEYRGRLEVVVNEAGAVEAAEMTIPTVDSYDLVLVSAARRWRFAPARRNGEPVKYRMTFDVALSPRK